MMDLADINRLAGQAPLAEGYRLVPLRRAEVGTLIAFIQRWFPAIGVGSASCYLRHEFYAKEVFFDGTPGRDVLVMLLERGHELAGMFSFERDTDTLTLHGQVAVAAPAHRGANLAGATLAMIEAFGRHMGMGLVYGMATLKAPHVQAAFERAGWQLIGITPGYDREMVAPGVVKRVYEAVYAKLLVSANSLLHPQRQNLTPRTQALFDHVCSADWLDRATRPEMPRPVEARRASQPGP